MSIVARAFRILGPAFSALSITSLGLAGCSQSEDHNGERKKTAAVAEAVDRCATIKGSTGYGRIGVTAWFQGVEDGIESSVAGRIDERGGFHLEETLELNGKCFVTARLQGIDEGNSYSAYFRCPITRIYRDEAGNLLISSASNGGCQNISSPRDPVTKDVSNVPTTDVLFGDVATGDVIEAMRPAGRSAASRSASIPEPAQNFVAPEPVPDLESLPERLSDGELVTEVAKPFSPPEAWITSDDYPPAAARKGIEGRVAYSLEVGADGRPTWCTVVSGSGSEVLDAATCRIVRRRAKFYPARENGNPVPGVYAGSVRWALPG